MLMMTVTTIMSWSMVQEGYFNDFSEDGCREDADDDSDNDDNN